MYLSEVKKRLLAGSPPLCPRPKREHYASKEAFKIAKAVWQRERDDWLEQVSIKTVANLTPAERNKKFREATKTARIAKKARAGDDGVAGPFTVVLAFRSRIVDYMEKIDAGPYKNLVQAWLDHDWPEDMWQVPSSRPTTAVVAKREGHTHHHQFICALCTECVQARNASQTASTASSSASSSTAIDGDDEGRDFYTACADDMAGAGSASLPDESVLNDESIDGWMNSDEFAGLDESQVGSGSPAAAIAADDGAPMTNNGMDDTSGAAAPVNQDLAQPQIAPSWTPDRAAPRANDARHERVQTTRRAGAGKGGRAGNDPPLSMVAPSPADSNTDMDDAASSEAADSASDKEDDGDGEPPRASPAGDADGDSDASEDGDDQEPAGASLRAAPWTEAQAEISREIAGSMWERFAPDAVPADKIDECIKGDLLDKVEQTNRDGLTRLSTRDAATLFGGPGNGDATGMTAGTGGAGSRGIRA